MEKNPSNFSITKFYSKYYGLLRVNKKKSEVKKGNPDKIRTRLRNEGLKPFVP